MRDLSLNKESIVVAVSLVLSLLCVQIEVSAQETYFSDINSVPIKDKRYTNLEGDPFLNEQWIVGTVKFENGRVVKNIPLKYDQVKGVLIFKNEHEQEFLFTNQVIEFQMPLIGTFRTNFSPSKGTTEKNFFQVLNDGKTKLLKLVTKSILETKPFYSGTSVKSIISETGYFVAKSDGTLHFLKNDLKSIVYILNDKNALITEFVKKNELNMKNETDIEKVIAYYNSLTI